MERTIIPEYPPITAGWQNVFEATLYDEAGDVRYRQYAPSYVRARGAAHKWFRDYTGDGGYGHSAETLIDVYAWRLDVAALNEEERRAPLPPLDIAERHRVVVLTLGGTEWELAYDGIRTGRVVVQAAQSIAGWQNAVRVYTSSGLLLMAWPVWPRERRGEDVLDLIRPEES